MRRIFAEKQALAAKGVPEGARKTVTALFSDIKGSTDLMQDLDPDEARAIVDPALSRMIEAVEQHGGYVVQSQGDGIFALFGAPVANEDHALQAIRAAIVMQESIVAYRGELTGQGKPPVEIRVGLNTGEMVLRSIPRGDLQLEYNAIGHAVNLAARIQTFASPGGIAVGEDTFKLAEGYFDFRSLGQKQVKGVRELVEIREVTGTGKLRSRFELAERRGLLPFVGRESELAVIRNAMHHAVSGRGQVVAVRGEPGLGKSRLFHEFKMTSVPGCEILETSCTSQAMAFPYVPLRELLTNYFDLAPQDGDEVWRQKIFDKSKSLDSALAQDGLYVCSLFGISGPEEARLRQTGPEVRQQLILDAVSRLLIAQSTRAPLVVIVEDLHWADSGTAEFLFPFAQRLAAHRILLLVNYRPEYQNRWKDHENATELNLKPLTNIETESLLSSMLGQASDARSTKDVVVALTEGNPFFVEELVRELLDKGLPGKDINTDSGISVPHNGITAVKVPTTVQGVLASRIDALNPSDKELLQRLSILGREFPLSLLQSFADRAESELQRELEQLQQSGFVYPVDDDARDGFKFKHSLTQQVAYNSMTADRRKLMHERAGRAIEEVFSNRIQDHYAELAYHYSNSANLDKAIDYLGNAGNQSVQIGAHRQAIAHLNSSNRCLQMLSERRKS